MGGGGGGVGVGGRERGGVKEKDSTCTNIILLSNGDS